MFAWPRPEGVARALHRWSLDAAKRHPELRKLGYFGSYARGDWGVGSDLDLIAIVEAADRPFHARGATWNLSALPVPADMLVYTEDEWSALQAEATRFARTLTREVVWIFP